MATLLTIGEFSRMTHLSIKALRHYHDTEVLIPAAVDPFTGYRSYDTAQVAAAQVVRRLRDLRMPLDSIRTILAAPDVETRNRELAEHLSRMERQLEQTQASVAALRGLLTGPAARPDIQFRSIPEVTALAIEEVVTVDDLAGWAPRAFGDLGDALAAGGLRASDCFGALFPGDFFETERARITLFVPVEGDAAPSVGRSVGRAGGPSAGSSGGPSAGSSGGPSAGSSDGRAVWPSDGRVRRTRIPAADVAVAVHEGPDDSIDQTYAALGTAVAGRAIGVDGPIREYYRIGFAETDDEARHRTEVCWPVFRTVPA
jgi:DNA-binding transcriptional MerR regulator